MAVEPKKLWQSAFEEQAGVTGQPLFEGVVALQEPSHWTVPLFVCPQEFWPDEQDAPSFEAHELGTVQKAEEVPEFTQIAVEPKKLWQSALDEQAGAAGQPLFEGVEASQEPSHWTVPLLVWPQEF
jgi:hypothetical protein